MGVVYVFGDFELDVDRFELRRAAEKVEVQPKVLRLLVHLIANRERAVTSDELLREVWRDTKVEPGSIKRAVLGARQALGERGAEHSSVRTVRGHGYQFVRDVTLIEPEHAPSPQQTASPAPSVSSRSLFIGRERVLTLLTDDLVSTLQGRSACVLLTGEPGIGKSRIAEQLWERARELGAETWLGRCTEGEGVPAFWPFVQVFRDATQQRGAEQVRELMSQAGPDLARAMKDLPGAFADLEQALSPDTHSARFRMFDSVGQLLRRAAERRPLVLGFDDLHLADAATLQLLTFIVRQAYAAPLFIVGTFRREAGTDSPLLAALASADRTRCLELRGFDREDLTRYLALAIGSQPPAFAVDALHEQTAGNPLFVRQLVEGSWTDETDWNALLRRSSGYGLHGAIERHLHIVSAACRELLRTAAALGREFSEALLVRVSDRTADEVRTQLLVAEAAQLIEPLSGPGRFSFTHGLIRDALYRQLGTGDRARLHGRAGSALEAGLVGLDYVLLAEVTRHFVLAAPAHDAGRALTYTLRAAETARTRFAYEEAAEHFKTALQLCDHEPPDAARRAQLSFRFAEALWRSAEFEAARRAIFEVLQMARELGDAGLLANAALLLVGLPDDSKVDPAAVSALREALAAVGDDASRRACIQACLARSLAHADARSERVALAHAALQGAATFEDLKLRGEVMTRCHEALVDPEHLRERVAINAELLQLAYSQSDSNGLLRALGAQIETCIERADYDGALDAAARMEKLAEQVREPLYRWQAKLVRALEAYVFGQPSLAQTRAKEARDCGMPIGAEGAHHVYAVQMTAIYVVQARMREAEPLVSEIAMRYPGLPGWEARLGSVDWNLGRHDQARARLARMMDRGLDWIRREPFALSGMCSVAELCAWTRDAQAAAALYPVVAPYAAHHGVTTLGAATYGPVSFYLAMLSACCGELQRSKQEFEQAYESALQVRSPTFRALVGATYAMVLPLTGAREDRVRAAELLREALAIARTCELHAVSQQCLESARLHGVNLAERSARQQAERS